MRTIIVCKGIVASGKTTWALEQLKRYPDKYKRINRDDLRAMLDRGRYNIDNEKFIYSIKKYIIEKSLRNNFDVIVDDTNLKEKDWMITCEIAEKIGDVRVMEKYFPVTLKEAIERNNQRDGNIPSHIVVTYYNKYIKNKKIEVRDNYFPRRTVDHSIVDSPDKKNAVIVDIDGTLALINNRNPYNLSNVLDDEINKPIKDLVLILSSKFDIIIVSGRDNTCREDTMLWLDINEIPYISVFLREEEDRRKDSIVKEEIYNKKIKPFYNIKYVLDDRQQTVDLWRHLKLCCLQVADGTF
jgi:predicted kinase